MESERTFRNHPSVIISNLLTVMVTIAILLFINISGQDIGDYGKYIAAVLSILGVLLLVLFARWWQKTTFEFTDSELIVRFDLLSKKVKRIQYSRLASVNVKRSIYNIIFGTSTLMFNVNSSVNSMNAEATLVLKKQDADELREALSKKIFDKKISVDEDLHMESMIHVSNLEVIIHGFLAQPTYSAIFGAVMMVYSIYSLLFGSGGGFIVAFILFVVSTAVPWIRIILKYYNYRIYRVDDTITVDSGLITNYRTSFKISKVNSIRIREPMLARILGRATLEAEVVGTADQFGMPILCPLKPKKEVEALITRLVPEFVVESELMKQPSKANGVMLISSLLVSAFASLCVYAVHSLISMSIDPEDVAIAHWIAEYGYVFVSAVFLLMVVRIPLANRRRAVSCSDDLFIFVIGGYDISTEIIRYDKVQIAEVSAGPVVRSLGLAVCTVSLISSMGPREITSGFFHPTTLEGIPFEVISRIEDGRYDYRQYL